MMESPKTVLVIEDSRVQALALQELLETEGLQVLHAPDGRIGVSMAQQHQPDIIVLDIVMPEMNGLEACKRLKQDPQTENIPIVMLTIRDRVTTFLQGLELGAIDFIPKDAYSEAVLLGTLRQLGILSALEETSPC
jgi:CheY-like chemotaxis protein